ncbi:hypothetical protein K438DRAFT_1766844 [Mycena galopus ATCC 62051]|nr:hypothetical protein K438DRAFT_1766844 [Mycena galopus ATCC 62051]
MPSQASPDSCETCTPSRRRTSSPWCRAGPSQDVKGKKHVCCLRLRSTPPDVDESDWDDGCEVGATVELPVEVKLVNAVTRRRARESEEGIAVCAPDVSVEGGVDAAGRRAGERAATRADERNGCRGGGTSCWKERRQTRARARVCDLEVARVVEVASGLRRWMPEVNDEWAVTETRQRERARLG